MSYTDTISDGGMDPRSRMQTPEYQAYVEDITGRNWPVIITEPGEYKTRNGLRVVVTNHDRQTKSSHFKCEGNIILREKPRRESWMTWKPNGQLCAIGRTEHDIVGRWAP